VLEHAVSDRLLEGIDERLGRPRFDPHGDAIPDADGNVDREPFVLLAAAPAGHSGRVLRVSDRDPELLRAVESASVEVGAEVTVTDATTLRISGAAVALPDGAAEAIWLSA
jgi:DtxR family Mn-dependent transcriptional regulator